MGLIDKYQIEASYGEVFLLLVDIPYHRLIGREHDSCIQVGRFVMVGENTGRLVGQQLYKVLMCLID